MGQSQFKNEEEGKKHKDALSEQAKIQDQINDGTNSLPILEKVQVVQDDGNAIQKVSKL